MDGPVIFYKKSVYILFFISSIFSSNAFADISKSADFLCVQISEKPDFKYEDYFSPTFISKIKYDQLISVFQSIYADDGSCLKVTVLNSDSTSSKIILKTNTTDQRFLISVDEKNLISGLQYLGRATPKTAINSIEDIRATLGSLGDISSFYVKNISTNSVVSEVNSSKRLALGSEFKLYVLNYLNQQIALQKINWNDKLKVSEEKKSLPSGILQNYPDGTELSVKQFAGLMISKSDNTATDHLIEYLGRENIETSMSGSNSFLPDNAPLLTTMDMFRLRTLSSDQVDQYLNSDLTRKRNFLSDLKNGLRREDVATKLQNWDQPKDIQKVEWYASTSDICTVTEIIKHQADFDKNIFDILSSSVPFVWLENDPSFEYVGYKGGSEPGVMTMTFLVKTKKQEWACISMGINNQKQSLNENQVADVYHAVLNYAGKLLNQ